MMSCRHKIHENMHVYYMSARFHVFSPFSAYFSPHDIIMEKGLLPNPYPQAAVYLL